MHLQTVSSAFALLLAGATDASTTCVTSDIQVVTKGATHPAWFCGFYNARCILAKAPASATAPVPALPQPTTEGVKGLCYAYDMKLLKTNYHDTTSFCNFFNGFSGANLPQEPVAGLSPTRAAAACTCITDGVVFPVATPKESKSRTASKAVTTTAQPFCSSAPVKSLLAEQKTAPRFCQHILNVMPVTQNATFVSTPPAVTVIETSVAIDVQTMYTTTPVPNTNIPLSYTSTTITLSATRCGNGNTNYKKRDMKMPVFSTPSYLSGKPTAYVTEACECVTDLATPTEVNTITVTASASTVTGPTVVKETTNQIDVIASLYTRGPVVATSTVTEPGTGVQTNGAVYTDTNLRDSYDWGYWTGVDLSSTGATLFVSCPWGDPNGCHTPDGYMYSKGDPYPGCMNLCDWYNWYMTGGCTGVTWNPTTNKCTLYKGGSKPLGMAGNDCVVNSANNGSYVAGVV
ncbi:hypothetical protein ANO11243_061660 [Dothideomycetidae sp. 11243]|nr:hypothetical protein ANO11243_061660 [fungal sp. No.11243]